MATYIDPSGRDVEATLDGEAVGCKQWLVRDGSSERFYRDDEFREMFVQKYPRAVDSEPPFRRAA